MTWGDWASVIWIAIILLWALNNLDRRIKQLEEKDNDR